MIHSSETSAGTIRKKNPVPLAKCQPFAATEESLPKREADTKLRNENQIF